MEVNGLQPPSNHNANNFLTYCINQHILHTQNPQRMKPKPRTATLQRLAWEELMCSFPEEVNFSLVGGLCLAALLSFCPGTEQWYVFIRSSSYNTKIILPCRNYRNTGRGCFPWCAMSSFISSPLWKSLSLSHFNGNAVLACELLVIFADTNHS